MRELLFLSVMQGAAHVVGGTSEGRSIVDALILFVRVDIPLDLKANFWAPLCLEHAITSRAESGPLICRRHTVCYVT